jgi:hypothetical protein
MSFLNPLAGTVAGQQLTQASLESEKVRQVRRAQTVSKNVAAANDRLEHEVESSDAIKPVDPNGRQSDPRQSKDQSKRQDTPAADNDGDDQQSHLDLKA